MHTRLTLLIALALTGAAATGAATAGQEAPAAQDGAAARATLTVRSSAFGRIVFDRNGRALYAFTRDRRGGPSTCYGACAAAWPPYIARGRLRVGPGIRRALLGTTRRRDGSRQVTYAGWPLYYYVGDRRPGEVRCQNVDQFGGLWLVQRPNGRLVR